MDKTALQQVLSRLAPVEDPDAELEQYATPPAIAADVLQRMQLNNDLDGTVLDLGCGNGIFAIGAGVLGADAVGVDVDGDAVAAARANLDTVEAAVDGSVTFETGDVRDLDRDVDVAVTNPPFGVQREDANLVFLEAAFETASVVYAVLHQSRGQPGKTRSFLDRFAADHGFSTDVVTAYDFPLPRRFAHHDAEKEFIKVDLYRFEQV
ncbi:MAG: METTL5 family protein [Candidatus Nanohaloarchaea archaeon]